MKVVINFELISFRCKNILFHVSAKLIMSMFPSCIASDFNVGLQHGFCCVVITPTIFVINLRPVRKYICIYSRT
jgi:hypothetical protein